MQLLGREREVPALHGLLDATRAGRGGALVLRGEHGVGLTALLEYAVASASDMRVVRGRGAAAESTLAFAALHQLSVSMLDRLDELPGPQQDALAAAFGRIGGPPPDRFLVGLAVLGLLAKAAEERPLLGVIDDVHWLDPASAEALAFVGCRLAGEAAALVLAVHEPDRPGASLAGIPDLRVGSLPQDAARALLASVVSGPLDATVRERLLAEAGGIPLGLVELPAQLTPDQLAGLSTLPEPLPVGERLRHSLVGSVGALPPETRTFLLLAAAAPKAAASVIWTAAARLAISVDAAAPAEAGGLVRVGQQIVFRHPLVRLAIYEAASVAERRKVHQALAETIDPRVDPDRRAWHRASASLAPDEDVATELEGAATRAKGRGDDASAAALLERAAGLTPDPGRRYGRTLAAVQAAVAAGSLGRATFLLAEAHPQPVDGLQRAEAERLRASIALALGQAADRATMLLSAARTLEPLDVRLARDSYLEALEAAVYTGRLGSGSLLETAQAARSAPPAPESRADPSDLLLDGLALLVSAGHEAATPAVRRAIEALRGADEPRWLALGCLAAIEIWDDEGLHELTTRRAELVGGLGGHPLPLALDPLAGMDDVLAGRLGTATAPFAEARDLPDQAEDGAGLIRPGELIAAAWRGRAAEARGLTEACMREAFARDLGLYVAVARYAIAVLELGLGRYEAAASAARQACEEPALYVVTSALPELIEAAARTGERELAFSAVGRLAERTLPSSTEWGLGTLARSQALLAEGAEAERLYQQAIGHLRRSRASPQLARAHLVYGEWLRRERRRREAREQLRTARDMFVFMGAQAFGERARVELAATGEHARRGAKKSSADLLTPQEAQIARLVADGASNGEIAARLFISPRTVEYHLHKVFRKLDVSSRTQLARALRETGDGPGPDP
jgi:DNA-binding CsgD family transcriptional regulator